MGRAERRRLERENRLLYSREKSVKMSKDELRSIKKKVSDASSENTVDILMTCFALAEHRLYGYGKKRCVKTLQYVDELMGGLSHDTATLEEYKQQLVDEVGLTISC